MEDQTGMQPAAQQAAPAVPVVKQVKELLSQDKIKEKFGEVLGQKAPQFMASITNTVSGSAQLKKCPANSIIGAAFVAATYDLPIDSKSVRSHRELLAQPFHMPVFSSSCLSVNLPC